jgi:hypothetical protein
VAVAAFIMLLLTERLARLVVLAVAVHKHLSIVLAVQEQQIKVLQAVLLSHFLLAAVAALAL